MRKRVLCMLLACCVFCSSVITNRKDAYALTGVEEAFTFALAGAMVVSAGYVAYQESDSIMEAGRAMCQESAEMYDTCKRYASQAVDGAVRFGKDSIADLKSMFNAVDSVFADGKEVSVEYSACTVRYDSYTNKPYYQFGNSVSFDTSDGVKILSCVGGLFDKDNDPNYFSMPYLYGGEGFIKKISKGSKGEMERAVASGNSYIEVSQYKSYSGIWDTYLVSSSGAGYIYLRKIDGASLIKDVSKSVACPRDESFPCDSNDVFNKWKDSISKGNDVIVRPQVGLPISNWGDVYSDDGLVSGVDLVGGSDPVVPENPDIPDYGEIGTGDIVDIPDGVIDKPIEGDGVTTGEGINGGILTGVAKLLNSILARLKALPALLGSALIGSGTLDFSKLTHSGLTTVFPFCIPFDIADGISSLVSEPKAPRFVVSFEGTLMESCPDIIIDLSQFERLAKVVRFFVFIGFAFGLALATRRLIKG